MSKRRQRLTRSVIGLHQQKKAIRSLQNIAQVGKRNQAAPRIAQAANGGTGIKQPAPIVPCSDRSISGQTVGMNSSRSHAQQSANTHVTTPRVSAP